jgi:hypothetical protein
VPKAGHASSAQSLPTSGHITTFNFPYIRIYKRFLVPGKIGTAVANA